MDLRQVIQNALQQINNPVRNNASIVKAASSAPLINIPDKSVLNYLPTTQGLKMMGIVGNGTPRNAENYQAAQNVLNRSSSPQDESLVKRKALEEMIAMAGNVTGGVKKINNPLEALYKTAMEYSKDVPVEKLNLNTPDFQTAMGDVLQGKKSFTPKMPSFIKDGVVVDGNTRIADQIRKGAKNVKVITDENIYNNLMEQVGKLLERPRDVVGRYTTR